MTSPSIASRLERTFYFSETIPNCYLTKDPKFGLTIAQTTPQHAASPAEVCKILYAELAKSLADTTNESYTTILDLKERIKSYKRRNPNELGIWYNHMDTIVDLVVIKALATSGQTLGARLLNCLKTTLKRFTILEEIADAEAVLLPKNGLQRLKDITLPILQADAEVSQEELQSVEAYYFPIACARWDLARGFAKSTNIITHPEQDSLDAERFLADTSLKCNKYFLKSLIFPRDILFIEKHILHDIKSLATHTFAVAQRVNTWLEEGKRTAYVDPSKNSRAVFFDSEETGIEELGLLLQTRKVCQRVVTDGTCVIDGILKKLLAYKKQPNHSEALYNTCIHLLETNELLYISNCLMKDWRRLDVAAEALTEIDSHKKLFETRSYLPRMRLGFLLKIGRALQNRLQSTANDPIQQRFSQLAKTTEFCRTILQRFEHHFITQDETQLYARITQKITNVVDQRTKKIDLLQRYMQIFFICGGYEEDYEEFSWPDTSISQYSKMTQGICNLSERIELTVLARIAYVESRLVDENSDSATLLQQQPALKKKHPKRKKRPKFRNPQSAINSVDQITDKVAELTITSTPLNYKAAALKAPLQTPITLKSSPVQLKYYKRVLQWFAKEQSMLDPFVSVEPYCSRSYSTAAKFWIRLEHNFALAVDTYIKEGLVNRNASQLKQFNIKAQFQLIGEISIKTKSLSETRQGVFTYGLAKDGAIKHRWFTLIGREDIINPEYAEKGWDLIKSTPIDQDDSSQEGSAMAHDGSKILAETDLLVTIEDPKNHAIIRIVRMLGQ